MINFRNARFIKSSPTKSERPHKNLPEILFIGRSNVGKSSLINAICDHKSLCFTSSKPGHTRLLNYFEINDSCYLVDAPGYGYSKAGKKHDLLFGEMMEGYFLNNERLSLVVFLIDSRRLIQDEEIELINYFKQMNIPFLIVMTKCDKLNQSEKYQLYKECEKYELSDNVNVSIKDKNSIELLKKMISNLIRI